MIESGGAELGPTEVARELVGGVAPPGTSIGLPWVCAVHPTKVTMTPAATPYTHERLT
ncbi:hypothetical protein [Actinokineospora diospyrosa]|uniref:hypothetical protein n=1 Tax=Actinokineospora diospyrosa TaxID=103728 RepID=UPI0020A30322|nr:hypothetical protein [Actinokineospora diospyrosa]